MTCKSATALADQILADCEGQPIERILAVLTQLIAVVIRTHVDEPEVARAFTDRILQSLFAFRVSLGDASRNYLVLPPTE